MTSPHAAPAVAVRAPGAGPTVELDALELWVQDLSCTRDVFLSPLGFRTVAADVTDRPGERAEAMVNGGVTVLLRQGTSATSTVARHVAAHGDTVGDVRLVCEDPAFIATRAAVHGIAVRGTIAAPTIDMCGDGTICHTVRDTRLVVDPPPSGFPPMVGIDHIAHCLPWGATAAMVRAYRDVLGLQRIDADSFDKVGDEPTGMRGTVLRAEKGLTVVLTEPISPAGTGQTQQFVDAHAGPGVQHIAIAYADLPMAVSALRSTGVEFLDIPEAYYDRAQRRMPNLPIPWDALRRLEILVDADHGGLLFQLFARPMTDRGTFFVELIQRAGATGFGANNVLALFEAVHASLDDVEPGHAIASPGAS